MTATKPLSRILRPAAAECALEVATDILSGRWKLVILWHLLAGELNFSDLCRYMPDATSGALHEQLQDLERNGLILRSVTPQAPATFEYAISPLGRTLEPIILALEDWSERYDCQDRSAATRPEGVTTATSFGAHQRHAANQPGTSSLCSNGRPA